MKKNIKTFIIVGILIILFVILTTNIISLASWSISKSYKIDSANMCITKIEPSTTIKRFKEKLGKDNVKVTDEDGNSIDNEDTQFIKTEYKVSVDGKEYTAIVYGDIDKDGEYSYKDIFAMESIIKGD